MEKNTRANLKERMLTMLSTADDIDTHISNLQEMFDVSETASFIVDADRQVEIFRETVCAHPTIVKVLEKFDFDFPDVKTHSFAQITDYLILHLPNVKYAQMAATRATANLAATTAYSALQSESQRLRDTIEQLKRKRSPDSSRKAVREKVNRTRRTRMGANGMAKRSSKTRHVRLTSPRPI
jgi:hypothetical protein